MRSFFYSAIIISLLTSVSTEVHAQAKGALHGLFSGLNDAMDRKRERESGLSEYEIMLLQRQRDFQREQQIKEMQRDQEIVAERDRQMMLETMRSNEQFRVNQERSMNDRKMQQQLDEIRQRQEYLNCGAPNGMKCN